MRKSTIERATAETKVTLSLVVGGEGRAMANTGVGFLDHMLTLLAGHGRFDLSVTCVGDTQVDAHHSVEDIAICLGRAFQEALGEKRGICRYGSVLLPMDEALILCAVDISGRGLLCYDLNIPAQRVGDFDTELTQEFMQAFAREARVTLHLKQLSGGNSHHIIEGAFKALGRALRQAASLDAALGEAIPSTKGTL
ncbi:MAG: imidazoleglycerol-phosphate dehydratase HisB [Christensenellaceae bacterium]|jgi:imidazoleglycerol-phosphate dehydratase|nr:imidazoleglycerol-phosphate dehydratase HisB [Christensenellaceae bacterium]